MKTLFIIKPDAYERGLNQEIIDIIKSRFNVIEKGRVSLSAQQVADFYCHLQGRPEVIKELQQHMTKRSVEFLIAEANDAIIEGRRLVGATNPMEADKNSIRGRFNEGTGNLTRNLIHASDSTDNMTRELTILRNK